MKVHSIYSISRNIALLRSQKLIESYVFQLNYVFKRNFEAERKFSQAVFLLVLSFAELSGPVNAYLS